MWLSLIYTTTRWYYGATPRAFFYSFFTRNTFISCNTTLFNAHFVAHNALVGFAGCKSKPAGKLRLRAVFDRIFGAFGSALLVATLYHPSLSFFLAYGYARGLVA